MKYVLLVDEDENEVMKNLKQLETIISDFYGGSVAYSML